MCVHEGLEAEYDSMKMIDKLINKQKYRERVLYLIIQLCLQVDNIEYL